MRAPIIAFCTCITLVLSAAPSTAQQTPPAATPTIASKTEGSRRIDGYIPLYWDDRAGKMWLEIPRFGEELLYYVSLPAGIGANDIGLNRGDLGPSYLVKFERVGPKVLMVEPNYSYRATTNSALEKKAVTDAFPQSVLWGFKVEAETDGRVLVDATDFFLRDAHGVVNTLRSSNQGAYRMEATRSAFYLDRTKGFPKNSEVEVTLTFVSDAPGNLLRSVAPTGESVTIRQHHSFVELPSGYTPREADPRAGFGGVSYQDLAVPISEPINVRWISRHRLEKRDPSAAVSDAVEPIVYYLDPGTPEPQRSALLEGGRWWNQAFEAAGYRNAFRVEMLPDSADPMDARYNVIQWVHRSTRGWSYGNSIVDPRTSEIIKGHVTLGSERVRQDFLLAEGLLSPYTTGNERPPEMEAMSIARLKQLSAHEIGHTLGISHNYISSAQGAQGRASVMDYPHPLVTLNANGTISLSNAYDAGIGEWDKIAIAYGYRDFAPGVNEKLALDTILSNGAKRGYTFLADNDARPLGSAHPQTHLWDNGTDASQELERMLTVRAAALNRFGERAIRSNMPLASMEEVLVPLYLHHRYQTEAASKSIGGAYYTYALRGDGQESYRRVPGDQQRRALDAVLKTLSPSVLKLPKQVIDVLPPRPFGWGMHQELFGRWTGITFDAISPAATASQMTFNLLLDPERAARLVQQNALDPSLPGFSTVLRAIDAAIITPVQTDSYDAELMRAVQRVYIDQLMSLAATARMPQVRAHATYHLTSLMNGFTQRAVGSPLAREVAAHRQLLALDIKRFMDRPMAPIPTPAVPGAPPGQPIGMPGMAWLSLMCDWM